MTPATRAVPAAMPWVLGNCVAQDRRVDDQDVRHREEGDKSTADFVTDRRAALGNLEERIK